MKTLKIQLLYGRLYFRIFYQCQSHVKFHSIIYKNNIFTKVMLAALAIILISIDKHFIMTIINLKWIYIWVPLTKFRTDEIYLKKTSFSPSLCFVEPNKDSYNEIDYPKTKEFFPCPLNLLYFEKPYNSQLRRFNMY